MERGLIAKGHRNFVKVIKMLCIFTVLGAVRSYSFVKTHQIVNFTRVNFAVCKHYALINLHIKEVMEFVRHIKYKYHFTYQQIKMRRRLFFAGGGLAWNSLEPPELLASGPTVTIGQSSLLPAETSLLYLP